MRKFGLAAILAVMLPLTGQACDMAYASCRHNDSLTDTNRSDTPKPKEAKPAYGWPGLHIENIGSMRVVVDSRIVGGVGVIVSYDKNGHLKVRDRTGRIFVLTDPSKTRPGSKPHAGVKAALATRSAATATDAPNTADDPNQPTTSYTDGSSASPAESDGAGQTSAAADGAGNEARTGASDHTAASGEAGASSASMEAAAQ